MPKVPLNGVSTKNFLLQLLPKPWGAQGVPAWGSARHGQLSHCWPLTWVSPDTCTEQPRACSGDSSLEEPTSRVHRHPQKWGRKTKASLEAGAGAFLFLLDATDLWAAVLLGKEPALGKKWFCFLTGESTRPLFPYSLQIIFFPQPVAALWPAPRLASDQTHCYLLKAE